MLLHILFVALTVFVARETQGLNFCSDYQPCRHRCYLCGNQTTDLCKCRFSECPTDWTDRRKVIAFDRFRQPGDRIDTHQYMFCDPIIPTRHCKEEDEEQVSIMSPTRGVSGTRLYFARCRCRDSTPMLIKRITYRDDYQTDLICANMMPPCNRLRVSSTRTIEMDRFSKDLVVQITENHCKCEPGLPSSEWNDRDRVLFVDHFAMWYGTHKFNKFSFCEKILPRKICTRSKKPNKEPFKLLHFEDTRKSYNKTKLKLARCRCPNARPMMLKRARLEIGFGTMSQYEYFVCPFDMPHLAVNSSCMTGRSIEPTVHGICSRGSSCQLVAARHYGYCRRLPEPYFRHKLKQLRTLH